jgi:uncharacterized membrane protein YfcA
MADSVWIILFVMAGGVMAGGLGALLGIGGGVFLVPMLDIALGLPFTTAAGISLMTVIATSTAVSAGTVGRHLINLRLGMVLEVATAAGGLLGGVSVRLLSAGTLRGLFGAVTAGIAIAMIGRLERRNVILDTNVDPGRLGGRFFEEESGAEVVYRVRRMPVALGASFVAGTLSSLLGIGGGILKVPALNAWCGVPLRAAAATSAFMIGVTAVAAAPIYYAHGDIVPHLAAAAVIGVLMGSQAGLAFSARWRSKWLKLLMAVVLLIVSGLMLTGAR